MEGSDVRMKFLIPSKLWICEILDNARAERYINLIEIVIIEIIVILDNNRDINYLHSFQENRHFVTVCNEKAFNFRANNA